MEQDYKQSDDNVWKVKFMHGLKIGFAGFEITNVHHAFIYFYSWSKMGKPSGKVKIISIISISGF
jgi:hypothetical protein